MLNLEKKLAIRENYFGPYTSVSLQLLMTYYDEFTLRIKFNWYKT